MAEQFQSLFADPSVEARYQARSRADRLPFVRIYGVIFMLMALTYSISGPWFLDGAANARSAVLLGLTLLVAGSYVAASFWSSYVEYPLVDFAALLLLSLLIGRVNIVLFDYLMQDQSALHAVAVINRLAVTAFAAVMLAGRWRLFILWLACDFLGWLGQIFEGSQDASAVTYAVLSYFSGVAVMIAINLTIASTTRRNFALAESLDVERAKNEELVLNMLPPAAVERIRDGRLVADAYGDASVIFIDIVGFSKLAKRVSPGHLIQLLNGFFNHADRCAAEHGVEKVKTVGDAYLAIAGANQPTANSADVAIDFARAVLEGMVEIGRAAGLDVGLRAGIHSGPVVGGVIGSTRMAYDYWGETVNMAARLEAAAPVNGLAISESTWLRTTRREEFGEPSIITLKGVGEVFVYRQGEMPDTLEEEL